MKNTVTKILTLVMICTMILCSVAMAETTEREVIKVAHCAPDFNTSQADAIAQYERVFAEYNADESNEYIIEYTPFSAEADLQTQITQVEGVIVSEYDVMMIFGVDTVGIVPAVQQAHDAGILVIDMNDIGMEDIVDVVFWGYNEEIFADLRDEYLQQYAAENPDALPLQTGIIYGKLNQLPQLPRGDRMVEFAEANPDIAVILDTQTGEWATDKAMSITEDWIQMYPEMNYVCCCNTTMAIGAIQALKSSGRLENTLVTTVDLTNDAISMLKAGELSLAVGCDKYDTAVAMLDLILKLYTGEEIDHVYRVEKSWCVTPENVDEYIQYLEDTGREYDPS